MKLLSRRISFPKHISFLTENKRKKDAWGMKPLNLTDKGHLISCCSLRPDH